MLFCLLANMKYNQFIRKLLYNFFNSSLHLAILHDITMTDTHSIEQQSSKSTTLSYRFQKFNLYLVVVLYIQLVLIIPSYKKLKLFKLPIKNDAILAYHWSMKMYTGLPLVI